jgi:hypothetical protein
MASLRFGRATFYFIWSATRRARSASVSCQIPLFVRAHPQTFTRTLLQSRRLAQIVHACRYDSNALLFVSFGPSQGVLSAKQSARSVSGSCQTPLFARPHTQTFTRTLLQRRRRAQIHLTRQYGLNAPLFIPIRSLQGELSAKQSATKHSKRSFWTSSHETINRACHN